MKQWKEPKIDELNISATEKHADQGNGSSRTCIYDPTVQCNAVGNGKGICKNCIYNTDGNIADLMS